MTQEVSDSENRMVEKIVKKVFIVLSVISSLRKEMVDE